MSRKQILAQCPRSIPQSTVTDIRIRAFDTQRSAKGLEDVGKGILELLRASYSTRDKSAKFAVAPVEPNHLYSKPLPQTQGMEMQPFLHELAPILKALDTFNLHAFYELKSAEEKKEKLEQSGMARAPIVSVTAKKRSAHDANLDKPQQRPPMKRSATSSTKDADRSAVKRGVGFAQTEQELMSEKRRQENIRPDQSSPIPQRSKLPVNLPDRPKSPNPAPIRDPGPSNTDYKSSLYAPNVTPNHSPNIENSRPNDATDTSGINGAIAASGTHLTDPTPSSSPNANVHPSRMAQVPSFPLPTSPARPRPKPRPSSRDPRLIHRNPISDTRR